MSITETRTNVSESTTIPSSTNNIDTTKIPGYDGPAQGNTKTTKTLNQSTTESNLETYTKTTQVHRTCRGPISIKEICFDAKYIILENSGSRGDVDISNWSISRKIDSNDDNIFVFPEKTIFKANSTIKIWGANQGKSNNKDEFVHRTEWGTGDLINTRVLNNQKSERALHNQRTAQ